MDTATVTGVGQEPTATGPPSERSALSSRQRLLTSALHAGPWYLALALVLVLTFLFRLWGIKQGLPYSYNVDEATHFVPRAIAYFSHDLNPHYFLNPPAYSYLLHIVFELWFGGADAVSRAYAGDPAGVFVVARLVAAVLGTVAVWLTYLAGQRLWGRSVGLLAAAILGLAFLPVFYSHLALNDVPTLAPVALALYGIAGVMRFGRRRDYLMAGLGVGLAAATKYTGGITLVCLLGAVVCDLAPRPRIAPLLRLATALGVALLAFAVANPYAVLDFSAFQSGVSQQASLAAGQEPVKLGTRSGNGIGYYLWTFTWGLGWVPSLAALGGALLLLARKRIDTALVFIPAPIAFVIFMGGQQRYFGRWLMPIFPLVALLAAYGAVELVRWLVRTWRFPVPLAGSLVAVTLLAQSAVADTHSDAVLSRPDTRNLTRSWMVAHVPEGSRVVIEPLVPDSWATDIGVPLPATPTGERWWRFPTWLTDLDASGKPLPVGERRYVVVDQYERTLRPALLDRYVNEGFCWVVLGSLQAGRAFAEPKAAPAATAYYAELANRARLVYHVSPFAVRAHPSPFNFDWSINYYPRQYRLPGPEMSVYRLIGGRCS
ncbi:MAG: glycosyltransferase family 39 protein [Actinomycetota bacterium]|nr:glycosyltransferase family 39 protein [Actinomycetota bacterium]